VRDRRQLAADGIVVPCGARQAHRPGGVAAEIVTRGFVDAGGRPELLEEAGRVLLEAVHGRSDEERADRP